jgi:hypothetical protein
MELRKLLLSGVLDDRGNLSAPRLAALTGYAVTTATFLRQQWNATFNETLWMIYIGATILHAGYDRAVDTFRALKEGGSAGDDKGQQ